MFKKISMLAAAAVLAMGTAASAATTIFEDNFDTESGVPTQGLAKWSIMSGSVDVVGAGSSFPWCGTNSRCLDMNGTAPGRIESIALTGLTVGKTYFLTFDFGNNQNSMSNTVAEVLSFGFVGGVVKTLNIFAQNSLTASNVYQLVAGNATEKLFFADTGTTPSDRGGPLLDNVQLSAVPVPAAGLLLIGALGGLAALRRRKTA